MISLSSHVLDTTIGKPAASLPLVLTLPDGSKVESLTDSDGRCKDWQGANFIKGQYSLRFQVAAYLEEKHGTSFYPYIDIPFIIQEEGHFHVPLLISPFGFSSYRGS